MQTVVAPSLYELIVVACGAATAICLLTIVERRRWRLHRQNELLIQPAFTGLSQPCTINKLAAPRCLRLARSGLSRTVVTAQNGGIDAHHARGRGTNVFMGKKRWSGGEVVPGMSVALGQKQRIYRRALLNPPFAGEDQPSSPDPHTPSRSSSAPARSSTFDFRFKTKFESPSGLEHVDDGGVANTLAQIETTLEELEAQQWHDANEAERKHLTKLGTAMAALGSGDISLAVADFEEADRAVPGKYVWQRGIALVLHGDYTEAAALLARCSRQYERAMGETDFESRIWHAVALRLAGRDAVAELPSDVVNIGKAPPPDPDFPPNPRLNVAFLVATAQAPLVKATEALDTITPPPTQPVTEQPTAASMHSLRLSVWIRLHLGLALGGDDAREQVAAAATAAAVVADFDATTGKGEEAGLQHLLPAVVESWLNRVALPPPRALAED